MTPDDFIAKWTAAELKERSAAQEHFIDLCRLLDEPTPTQLGWLTPAEFAIGNARSKQRPSRAAQPEGSAPMAVAPTARMGSNQVGTLTPAG